MADDRPSLAAVWWRALTLRFSVRDGEALGWPHLVVGLLMVWVVGMGRYWDNPRAHIGQVLGLGSVVYVFGLSALLYLSALGMRPKRLNYGKVLTYVCLTAPPGLLYALPVQWWMDLDAANSVNVAFLANVALWRVLMFGRFLRVWCAFSWAMVALTLLLPIAAIIFVIAVLNLEHVVYDLMAGITEPSPNDEAYMIVFLLAWVSMYAAPCLLIGYLFAAVVRWTPQETVAEGEAGAGRGDA